MEATGWWVTVEVQFSCGELARLRLFLKHGLWPFQSFGRKNEPTESLLTNVLAVLRLLTPLLAADVKRADYAIANRWILCCPTAIGLQANHYFS